MDGFGQQNPKGMPPHFFLRAVRMDYETAQRADFEKQNYTVCPRFWYIDAAFLCEDCGQQFVFTAEEQRFWYEERGFYVDSTPNRCVSCRKANRTRLDLKRQYDTSIISEE